MGVKQPAPSKGMIDVGKLVVSDMQIRINEEALDFAMYYSRKERDD